MKQLIKGIDILLYSGSSAETVSNVLVGNSVTSGVIDMAQNSGPMQTFTLAIPKGDTHDWNNRIVEFWGFKYRTVGVPLQGIEENIPLSWHKQVNVQRLDINDTCTIFEKDSYTKHDFENIYSFDERGQATRTDGKVKNGVLNVQIYADRFRTDIYKPKAGDILVLGDCDFVFDTSSQQATSACMTDFRKLYDFAIVDEVQSVSYGSIPDYIIKAR